MDRGGCSGVVPRQPHKLKAPCKSDTRYLGSKKPQPALTGLGLFSNAPLDARANVLHKMLVEQCVRASSFPDPVDDPVCGYLLNCQAVHG